MAQAEQSNEDVTIGITGDPYRVSQFESINNWTGAGFSKDSNQLSWSD